MMVVWWRSRLHSRIYEYSSPGLALRGFTTSRTVALPDGWIFHRISAWKLHTNNNFFSFTKNCLFLPQSQPSLRAPSKKPPFFVENVANKMGRNTTSHPKSQNVKSVSLFFIFLCFFVSLVVFCFVLLCFFRNSQILWSTVIFGVPSKQTNMESPNTFLPPHSLTIWQNLGEHHQKMFFLATRRGLEPQRQISGRLGLRVSWVKSWIPDLSASKRFTLLCWIQTCQCSRHVNARNCQNVPKII